MEIRKTVGNLYILNHTLNECSLDLPMFISEDGAINVVVGIYSPAGAEKYDRIVKVK